MPKTGGPADKFGNYYELLWTVKSIIEVMNEQAVSIRLEPLGPEGEGVEFWLQRNNGSREYHQVKRQHGESGYWSIAHLDGKHVLTRFREKLATASSICVFVSMHAAYQVEELSDRARRATSLQEFRDFCLDGKNIALQFEELCRRWQNCPELEAYEMLKRLQVETISEKLLNTMVQSHLSYLVERSSTEKLEGDAATAVDILVQLALKSVHEEKTAHDIWHYLEIRGYRRCNWGKDSHILRNVHSKTDQYLAMLRKTLIAGEGIPRDEAHVILHMLLVPDQRGHVMLSAAAGMGKSSVLLQVVEALREKSIPLFAFRVDQLTPTFDPDTIGRQLSLPGSPINVLAALAQGRDCVLIIDQLDAVSITSGRNSGFFDSLQMLIQQVQFYPKLHLLMACRKFDLENDHRLRGLTGKGEYTTVVSLDSLPQTVVQGVINHLGFDTSQLSQKQLLLLSHPFHLSLLASIAHTIPTKAITIESANELYSTFWDSKEKAVSVRLGYPVQWVTILNMLVQKMSEKQRLFVHESVLLAYRPEVRAMVSEHVLIQDNKQYSFFHESFFDYVFARLFASHDEPLVSFLCKSEQHLFRRAQIRQILLHRREADFDRYLDDLVSLLTSPSIRFHLKHITFALLKDITQPTEDEWNVLATLLDDPNPYAQHAWQVLYGSSAWFQLLDQLGVITKWLTDTTPSRREQLFFLFGGVQRQQAERVAQLVSLLLESEGVKASVVQLLLWSDLSKSRLFFNLVLASIDRGWFDEAPATRTSNTGLFWNLLHALPLQQPEWACEAIRHFLQRCLSLSIEAGQPNPFSDELALMSRISPHDRTLLDSAAGAPKSFFREVFPFMYAVMHLTARSEETIPRQDTVWGRLQRRYGRGDDVQDALLYAMEQAISCIAQDTPQYFALIAQFLQSCEVETAHYLLMRGYTANGETFTEDAVHYLCNTTTQLEIGYAISTHWTTRELVEAIAPHCSNQLFEQLEERLFLYASSYEKSRRGYETRSFGFAQLTLLEGIPPAYRSLKVHQRIAQWRRKFPLARIQAPALPTAAWGSSFVGSPISQEAAEKMSDAQWLKAIVRHNAGLIRVRPDGSLVGGISSVASQLAKQAALEPQRFAAIVQQLPEDTPSAYFDAVLRGIADTSIDSQTVLNVCRKCHSLPSRPCGYWICYALAKQSKSALPSEALEMIAWYATEYVQPDSQEWRASLQDSLDRHTDPITAAGKESVRGNAAEVIGLLISSDFNRIATFLPCLELVAEDASLVVRACAVLAVQAVFKYDSTEALSLFTRLCNTEDVLLQSSTVEHFLAIALHRQFVAIEPILHRMLQSTLADVNRVGSRLVCVSALVRDEAHPLAEICLTGSESKRIGAAEIFTAHLSRAPFRTFCEQALIRLFNDPSEKVRAQVVKCFDDFKENQLGNYDQFIETYISSQSFAENPYHLIQALKQTTARLPETTCLVCEKFLGLISGNHYDSTVYSFLRADTIGDLLLRVYNQQKAPELQARCLDLIDRILLFKDQSLNHLLSDYDR